MTLSTLSTLPFYLHLLIELPASLNFLLNPASQLPTPAPQAHALIRQYAVLLFTSCLISLIFATRDLDRTSRNVAGALAVYHVAPLARALGRIAGGEVRGDLGGPWVHGVVHGVCLVGLGRLYLGGRGRRY